MEGSKVELRIEVDPLTKPITGSARRPQGDRLEFVGWTGLMGAIDRLLAPDKVKATDKCKAPRRRSRP
jgi:hypothetical protein